MTATARFKYSYSTLSYGDEDVGESIERVARCGYDGIEVTAELQKHDVDRVKRLIADAGIEVSSVCGMFEEEQDLSHPDANRRQQALDYLRAAAEFTAALDSRMLVVAPTVWMRTAPVADASDEWKWAIESLRAGGDYAASIGVDLLLEPWNRYETYLLNRLEQGAQMWQETGLENGGLLADTFHMEIEERSVVGAFRDAGTLVKHVHLADSNRATPGLGHTDFEAILRALVDGGYEGYLAFEVLPAGVGYPVPAESFGQETAEAIRVIKEVESRVRGSAA